MSEGMDIRMVGGPRDGIIAGFEHHPHKRIIWPADHGRLAVYEVQPPTPPDENPSIAVFAGFREKS